MSSHTNSALAKCLLVCVALFGIFFSQTSAMALTSLEKRDVYTPPVLYPHAGTVWYKGQTHNVTWYVFFLSSVCKPALTHDTRAQGRL